VVTIERGKRGAEQADKIEEKQVRLKGVKSGEGGWFVRVVFWFLTQKLGQVPAPLRVYAYRPSIMRGFLGLARVVERPGVLPERLKRLAMYWTARLVECRF
jgi:hypothetical protein